MIIYRILNNINNKSYTELPRKPRPLAAGMNWQNNCKNHLANSKYDSILQVRY